MGVSVYQNDTLYLSSKEAGRLSGYTSDYISRLARQGKVVATRVGTQWFVEPKSLEQFLQFAEQSKDERNSQLRLERLSERVVETVKSTPSSTTTVLASDSDIDKIFSSSTRRAHTSALVTVVLGFALAFAFTQGDAVKDVSTRLLTETRFTAYGLYQLTAVRPSGNAMLSTVGVHSGDADTTTLVPLAGTPVANSGLVILPDTVASATVKFIQESFSDEVHVVLDAGGSTGIVTPVFSDGAGAPHRFILVPLTSTPP